MLNIKPEVVICQYKFLSYREQIMKKQQPVMNVDVCDLLFKIVEKPQNMVHCKAINVYDNRYRINIYTTNYDNIYDIEKIRITESYFCQLLGDKLDIKYPNKV